jgi:hypothetical protein
VGGFGGALGFAAGLVFAAVFAFAAVGFGLAAAFFFAAFEAARRGLRVPGRASGRLPKTPPWVSESGCFGSGVSVIRPYSTTFASNRLGVMVLELARPCVVVCDQPCAF